MRSLHSNAIRIRNVRDKNATTGATRLRKFILPGVYLAFAAYVWIDFMRLPKDGLANIGLMLVTFPVTVVGLALTELTGGGSFVLLPDGFGYYADHALYYWPSVMVIVVGLYWISVSIRRWRR
jgi:hypothetical protein